MATALDQLREIYETATTIRTGPHLTTINAFTDHVVPLSPDLLRDLATLILSQSAVDFDLVVGEEDKGAHIATSFALCANRPLTLARWYVYATNSLHPLSVVVPLESEYFSGQLILNGVQSGDKVFIVEDTIGTGGTLAALIQAVRLREAVVVRAVAVVEKSGMGGVSRVYEDTGVMVDTLIRISVNETSVEVV